MLTKHSEARLNYLSPHFIRVPIQISWSPAGYMTGEYASSAPGAGLNYCEFKPYRPGDNSKRINAKMLARRPDHPVVTLYEEDRRITVAVLVDVGPSMKFGTQDLLKEELAMVLAGSIFKSTMVSDLAYFAAYAGDKLGCCLKDKPACATLQPALKAMLEDPALAPAKKGSGLAAGLARLPKERSLVFVVSDFLNMTDADRETLTANAKKHEVVCLMVQDLRERELPNLLLSPWLPLPMFCEACDVAGGTRLVLPTARTRSRYHQAFVDQQAAVTTFLSASRCSCAIFSTEESSSARKTRLTRVLNGKRSFHVLNQPVDTVSTASDLSSSDCERSQQ